MFTYSMEVNMKRIAIEIKTDELCSYGCGNKAHYINGSNRLMCEERSTKCPKIKKKNSEGLKKAHQNHFDGKKIYTSLSQEIKDRMAWSRGNCSADFSHKGKGNHKEVLLRERGHQCENCKNTEWLCEPIPLELEHCDGDNWNNVKENLLLLCPNCHAKTKFYRGKNNTGKIKVTDKPTY